jgi:hypothetical protein
VPPVDDHEAPPPAGVFPVAPGQGYALPEPSWITFPKVAATSPTAILSLQPRRQSQTET